MSVANPTLGFEGALGIGKANALNFSGELARPLQV
jgi:hypothetical protein